jgi:nucleoside-diphosphate-sugar epimerase
MTAEINVNGTRNIALACEKSGAKLYFASTCGVYGNQNHHPIDETDTPNPTEVYAQSKLAGESVIRKVGVVSDKLRYTIMRFATVYGPGTKPSLGTHIFFRQAVKGEPITIHGDGSQTRTLTYVDDLIDAVITLYQVGLSGTFGTWNIANEEEVSARKMAETIKSVTRSKSELIFISQRSGQTTHESISTDKIYRDTGWKAKVSWNDGVRLMYKWFRETGQENNVYVMPR